MTARRRGSSVAALRRFALALPGVEEGTSYGTTAFKVKGKLFARMWEDGETLVLRMEPEGRDALIAAEPDRFFLTDHYRGHPWVLVRLPRIAPAALEALVEDAWEQRAPKRLIVERSSPGGEC